MSLEPLVPKSWWKTLFADEMYLKTDGDVVEDPSITAAEVDQLLSDPHILSILGNLIIQIIIHYLI